MDIRAVVVRQECRGMQVDFGSDPQRGIQVWLAACFQGSNRLLDHVNINLESDRRDFP